MKVGNAVSARYAAMSACMFSEHMGIRVVSRVIPRPYTDRDGDFFMQNDRKGNDSDEREITEHQRRGVKSH